MLDTDIKSYFANNAREPEGHRAPHSHDLEIARFCSMTFNHIVGTDIPYPPKVIDLCAGKGRVSELVKAEVPQAEITGIDFVEEALEIALSKGHIDLAATVDLTSGVLPQADNSVDGIFCMRGSQYFTADEIGDIATEAHRVLRQGGFFLCSNLIKKPDTTDAETESIMSTNPHIRALLKYEEWQEIHSQAGFRMGSDLTKQSVIPSSNTALEVGLFYNFS